jgi:redox-sensing transcriptional repressor
MEPFEQDSISYPTIRRIPLYLPVLRQADSEGQKTISSAKMAELLHLDPVLVRKDIASLGIPGQARIGFDIQDVLGRIEKLLGLSDTNEAFVIGAGNLGSALANYTGFQDYGLKIVGLFDSHPDKIGREIADIPVMPMEKFEHLVQRMHIHIAILTVPASAAKACAEVAVRAGIRAVWNFTPVKLNLPPNVIVERVDLAASLAVLSSKLASVLKSKEVSNA